MRRSIGMLAENYSKWERRAPLTPSHVRKIVQSGIDCLVQPSHRRVFTDREYQAAGAIITRDLSPTTAIFGVKQPTVGTLLEEKRYVFFSHTIKAQQENMALLDEVLDKKISLIDYECVREGGGGASPRLIAFGGYAGKAGMISGLRGLGLRLLALGHSTPFLSIGPPHSYQDYTDACRALKGVGGQIKEGGLPTHIAPFVVCITGTGNAAQGARASLSALGDDVVEWVTPEDLPQLSRLVGTEGAHQHKVYACMLTSKDMVRRRGGEHGGTGDGKETPAGFDKAHYYSSPHEYVPCFHETIAPHTSMLVNAMYWERRFPRLLTNEQLANLPPLQAPSGSPGSGPGSGLGTLSGLDGEEELLRRRLLAVADVTCDVHGSVEALVRDSSVDDPFYLFDDRVGRESASKLLDGSGLLMLGVDILPSELPKESSNHFADALLPFVEVLATAGTALPPELDAATIATAGALTPAYQYIHSIRSGRNRGHEPGADRSSLAAIALEGSTVLSLQGNLFDSGLINAALDVVEAAGGSFALLEVNVRPNATDRTTQLLSSRQTSSALLQLTLPDGRGKLDEVISQLGALSSRMPKAQATITEVPGYCNGIFDRTIHDATAATATGQPTGASSSSATASKVFSGKGRRLVVLGAGLCASPAVELLSRSGEDSVAVVSSVPGEAAGLCHALRRPNVEPVTLEATPGSKAWASVVELLGSADAVLSLLPAPLHAPVAAECIRQRTPLVTASYVSDELAAMHDAAVAAGVPILSEMGLDPGMDHMSAAELIRRAQADGGLVTSFRSLCGGLPAPEVASTTPLAYKFSWSPAGVLSASKNPARYRSNGAVINVSGDELLHSAAPLSDGRLGRTFNMEVLPNRDSLPYASIYGIENAPTVFRGTLRYAGWSALFAEFSRMGLTGAAPLPHGVDTWPALLSHLGVPNEPSECGSAQQARAVEALLHLLHGDGEGPMDGGRDDSQQLLLGAHPSISGAFCALLSSRLTYGPSERDAVFMEHSLRVEYPGSQRPAELISSSLVSYGDAGGDTSMSRTVGLTAALGVCRLLEPPTDATPQLQGVLRPTLASVYEYCLPRLADEGLSFTESRSLCPASQPVAAELGMEVPEHQGVSQGRERAAGAA